MTVSENEDEQAVWGESVKTRKKWPVLKLSVLSFGIALEEGPWCCEEVETGSKLTDFLI